MSDTSDSDSSIEEISEISSTNNQLSEKSKKLYEKAYQDFMAWRTRKSFSSFSEKVLILYFQELSTKFKITSLWTIYSKLKMMLIIKHEVDIGKYVKINVFLRRKSEGYTKKKSKAFTAEDVNKFLKEAPDDEYLTTKVALILGVMGGCRRKELHKLKLNDVEVFGSTILVKVLAFKSETLRTFTVMGKHTELVKKYMSLRPDDCHNPYFFLNYKLGKFTGMNFGINKFGGLAKSIAKYLKLPDYQLYTGQCFRRTSTRIFVDAEGNIRGLRENRRTAVAEENKTIPEENNKEDKTGKAAESDKNYKNDTSHYVNIKIEETFENDKCEIDTQDYIDNLIENATQATNENLNNIEKDIFEFINVPSTSNSTNLQNSNSCNGSNSKTVVKDNGTDDSVKNKPQVRNQMFNTISNQTIEVVNINIPNIADLPSSFVPVNFNNCTIRNVNYYYNK